MAKLNVDCLSLIFNKVTDDPKSLYYFLLANKKWCNIVVPILWNKSSTWSRYFEYRGKSESSRKFFNTVLSCLPHSSKQFLSDNGIKLPSTISLKAPLFNYISFLKFPNSSKMDNIVISVRISTSLEDNYVSQEKILK